MQESTGMAVARPELHPVVVQRQYGYRYHIYLTPQFAVQCQMDSIHLIHHLRAKRATVHHILGYLSREVHSIS